MELRPDEQVEVNPETPCDKSNTQAPLDLEENDDQEVDDRPLVFFPLVETYYGSIAQGEHPQSQLIVQGVPPEFPQATNSLTEGSTEKALRDLHNTQANFRFKVEARHIVGALGATKTGQ